MKFTPKILIHDSFEISIFLKAFDSVLQILGAIALLIIRPELISRWVLSITHIELVDDWNYLSNYLSAFSLSFSHQAQLFASIYLASHGVIKLFIIWNLWKKRLWAYPMAITIFALFGVYQVYRYFITHSLGMIILTVLDVLVIGLTYLEYNNLKNTKLDIASEPAAGKTSL